MTKADRIRALYAAGKSTREIADIIGCKTSYVRVVARQRRGGLSEHDIKYLPRKNEIRRAAYHAARKRGLGSSEASRFTSMRSIDP